MAIGLVGKKVGMTQIFDEGGRAWPVTVVEAGPCPVVQKKTREKDGYEALQLGFEALKEARSKKLSRPLRGHFDKVKVPCTRHLQEIRTDRGENYSVGQTLTVEVFQEGDAVEVTGISKGKGFQGGVKRWGYKGGPQTHGSMFHRAPGSIGASSFPSRVFKGHHMPGHMGAERVTVKGLKVLKIFPKHNLLLVTGAVPGANGGIMIIRKSG
ncbi:MAG: 50S ribosomal protein L3 [bacterium]|jgi:large subunit ribosomal protein L3